MNKKFLIVGVVLVLLTVVFGGCIQQNGTEETSGVVDTDGDGYKDNIDAFPNDPYEWKDNDNDGVGDNSDEYPNNANEQYDSDNDGVGNNADDFPYDSTQWSDRDGDGYGDSSKGNNPDTFPDDYSEWKDSDSDGIGDNADIYDYGNGGIEVSITKYEGDGYPDYNEDGGTIDPFFFISIEARKTIGSIGATYSKTSTSAHKDQIVIYSPLTYTVDVEDDIKIVIVSVSAYDNDPWDNPYLVTASDAIDVNEGDYYWVTSDYFYPRTNTYQSFSHDGRLDSKDEMDGLVEYYISVVEI